MVRSALLLDGRDADARSLVLGREDGGLRIIFPAAHAQPRSIEAGSPRMVVIALRPRHRCMALTPSEGLCPVSTGKEPVWIAEPHDTTMDDTGPLNRSTVSVRFTTTVRLVACSPLLLALTASPSPSRNGPVTAQRRGGGVREWLSSSPSSWDTGRVHRRPRRHLVLVVTNAASRTYLKWTYDRRTAAPTVRTVESFGFASPEACAHFPGKVRDCH